MKKLVLTIAIGPYHQGMGRVTHPLLKAYADRIGADFKVITEQAISKTTPHWEKFQISALLEEYDRILFLDTDVVVRGDTPDLFEVVPEPLLGAFNEAPYAKRGSGILNGVAQGYGVSLDGWDGRYFNTGVMVISRCHREVFLKPDEEIDYFYEQSYLNLTFFKNKVAMHELEYRFNRMMCMDAFIPEHRLDAYIVHYAGVEDPDPERVYSFIESEIQLWRDNGFLP